MPRDHEVLRFIGEQFAVSMDQLQRMLAVGTDRGARRVRDRWRDAGWVDSYPLLGRGPTMVWLTHRGLRRVGLDYHVWEPNATMAPHIRATAEVRLLLAEQMPHATWICERTLTRHDHATKKPPHRPDAVLEIGDRRVAIEVELTQKSRSRLFWIVHDLLESHDAAWYFASPSTLRPLEALAAEATGGRLAVRALPEELC